MSQRSFQRELNALLGLDLWWKAFIILQAYSFRDLVRKHQGHSSCDLETQNGLCPHRNLHSISGPDVCNHMVEEVESLQAGYLRDLVMQHHFQTQV